MCTLVFAWQVFADAPVAVAANRDEAVDRPSESPAVIAEEPRVLAPRDAEAGGTWIGVNEFGVCVALTNRWIDADPAGERSRGLLVREALARESAEEAARFVERAVESTGYEAFNLICLDANAAILCGWDGHLRVENLTPGVQVVTNVGRVGNVAIPTSLADRAREQAENGRAVRQVLRVEPGESVAEWRDRAASVLGDHEYGVCVHGEDFGTRSSSLLTLHAGDTERGEFRVEYEYADGPPCRNPFERVEAGV